MTFFPLSFPKLSTRQFAWDSGVLFVAIFWLGGSLMLDLVVMPMLYMGGMMTPSSFASAGYSLFEVFNHVEMLLAGVILTGVLAMRQAHADCSVEVSGSRSRWSLLLAGSLVAISLLYAYVLTPAMGSISIVLDMPPSASTAIPEAMGWMHGIYWSIEISKIMILSFLLRLCYSDIAAQFTEQS